MRSYRSYLNTCFLPAPHTPVNWTRKQSKALGNLSAFLSLLVQSLQAFLEAPEMAPDATPLALLSIMSTLFANLVLANAVTEALGALVQPLALFYKSAAGGGAEFSPQLQGKVSTSPNLSMKPSIWFREAPIKYQYLYWS